jgi:hypothetical protein
LKDGLSNDWPDLGHVSISKTEKVLQRKSRQCSQKKKEAMEVPETKTRDVDHNNYKNVSRENTSKWSLLNITQRALSRC